MTIIQNIRYKSLIIYIIICITFIYGDENNIDNRFAKVIDSLHTIRTTSPGRALRYGRNILDNYSPDDCDHCWQSFCYSFFQEGLDGDPAHSVYYDLTIEECESYGYSYYSPDHPSNPYWNSNCSDDCAGIPNGDALVDECGDCQQSYCYYY